MATNGTVTSIANVGNTLYLLGSFTSIGANTGGGVPVDAVTGAPASSYSRVNGRIYACTSDGAGGWFIGGDFTAVGGIERANLAHVEAGGSVASWRADADGPVRALALVGRALYVGGDFTHLADRERDHIAAVSIDDGQLSAWNPSVSGVALAFTTVYSILPAAGVVYVGGDFTSVQGASRRCLAALDQSVPSVLPFDPEPDYVVRALACRDSNLYVGGSFYSVDQQACQGLACVSTTTGALRQWGGGVSHPDYGYSDVDAYVSALTVCDTSLYIAGHFTRVDSVVRGGLAAVDLATGRPQSWDPNPVDETKLSRAPIMYSIAVTGDVAYVGGFFGAMGGVERSSVASIARATGSVGGFDPRASGEVFVVGASDQGAFVGGAFSSLGVLQTRNQLAAIDLATGALKAWNPDPGVGQVMCMAADQQAVYIGGRFTDVNGVARQNLAAVDPETGDLLRWDPGAAEGQFTAVSSMALGGGWVYIGGDFATVGGVPRHALAAIDTAGRVGPWDPEPSSLVTAICPHGATVYVAGAFTQIGGQPRMMLAELDTTLGTATSWDPGTDGWVDALAVYGDIVYAGGQFQELGGATRASLGAIDRATGLATAWDPNAGNSPFSSVPIIYGLCPAGGAVYVAGSFGAIGGATHFFGAALDTGSALALDWDPEISAGPLRTLLAKDQTIYFGGRLNRYGTSPAGGLGSWPAIKPAPGPGERVAVGACYPNPATTNATLSFVLPAPAQVSLSIFDVQGRRVGRPIANEVRAAGAQHASLPVEDWPPGCYLCRLDIGGSAFTRKLVVLRR